MPNEISEYKYDKKLDEFVLNCCDWKAIKEVSDTERILVIVGFRTYRILIETMKFEEFYKLTQDYKYKSVYLPADFVGVALPCSKCNGNGTLDWVQKVMAKKDLIPDPHKRDPYARTLKFKIPMDVDPHWAHPFSPSHIPPKNRRSFQYVYTSYPHLTDEEEYCPKCYGSGLREITHKRVQLVKSIEGVKL